MLTLLRKIRRSLLASNQFRRYLLYAIGEIALVVIGILIALQINNWNEWRKERRLEKEILNDIQLNLESNISVLEGRISYFDRGQKAGAIILDLLENRLPYHDSLGTHFSRATRGYGGADVISYVGYESLRNNGFNIIINKSLRDEILNLFETTYRSIISFDETFKLQNSYHKDVVGRLLYMDKPSSLKPFDFEELVGSPRYYSSVSDHHYNYQWMKAETVAGLEETKRVLELVKDELDE